jgi:hypothetical protein
MKLYKSLFYFFTLMQQISIIKESSISENNGTIQKLLKTKTYIKIIFSDFGDLLKILRNI